MISFPKAKINLGLRITSKRPDGFHDIETIFYPIGLTDALEFVEICRPASHDHLKVTGMELESPPENNLVMKAVDILRERYHFPLLSIHLHKVIPSGAGLGGGSSDGACMIKALSKKYNMQLTVGEMKMLALELGSDCPFFIDCTPSAATGRGEKLKPVEPLLKGYYLVLANPGIHISTKEAYSNCRPSQPATSLEEQYNSPVEEWKKLIFNDFESYVFRKFPKVGNLKDLFYASGAVYASMTGSGSSVFGIYREKPKVSAALGRHLVWEGYL